MIFAGGTDNPYNYNGIGYDGEPSVPRELVFGFNVETGEWRRFGRLAVATMDHRGLVMAGDALIIVGGMEAAQRVSDRVTITTLVDLLEGGQ